MIQEHFKNTFEHLYKTFQKYFCKVTVMFFVKTFFERISIMFLEHIHDTVPGSFVGKHFHCKNVSGTIWKHSKNYFRNVSGMIQKNVSGTFLSNSQIRKICCLIGIFSYNLQILFWKFNQNVKYIQVDITCIHSPQIFARQFNDRTWINIFKQNLDTIFFNPVKSITYIGIDHFYIIRMSAIW